MKDEVASRRLLAALFAGALLWSAAAIGQSYPNRPIRSVVPHAPGGATDIRERFVRDGIEPIGSTSEQFANHIRRECIKWARVVKDFSSRAE